jgi:hypothetical protein
MGRLSDTVGSRADGNIGKFLWQSVDAAQLIFVQAQALGESCRMIA